MRITEEEYLEHFGTKGMKWGVRKAQSGAQKGVRAAKIGGAGATAALVARHYLQKKRFPSALLVGTAGAAVLGSVAAKAYLDRNGDKKLSELSAS